MTAPKRRGDVQGTLTPIADPLDASIALVLDRGIGPRTRTFFGSL